MITHEQVKQRLNYDPITGIFTWIEPKAKQLKVGDIAGHTHPNGYHYIKIDNKRFFAHRLAWLYVYGVWPNNQVDHIDGNRLNNAISNLREATNAQNQQNKKQYKNNKSGYVGITWQKSVGKWKAEIRLNGKLHYLGLFVCPHEANRAREVAKAQLHTFNPVQR